MDKNLVRDFVGACHRDLDAVKSFLQKEPGLVNASFNHGSGLLVCAVLEYGKTLQRRLALGDRAICILIVGCES